ncbi:MAG: hypothetical protein QN183_04645 [Armatimonadota bacterium]|nr:hypothetical protein [Armatimonadota bacterium]MDR7532417.1 hypothetical protein [Armatimonadota bacterium]MDR7535640.1 hypothetical protein [Armatimonadota bacterium]
MRRAVLAAAGLAAVALAGGCQRPAAQGPAPRAASPTPAVAPTPAAPAVGVVDLQAALRAHRRWPQLEALLKKIEALEVRLATPPLPPPVPLRDVRPELQAEADRLAAGYRAELAAMEEQARQRLDAFAADVKAEQEAKLAEEHRRLNEDLRQVIEAKRDEMQRELDRFEVQTMAEYRIPLLNLRLKGDVVGIANEEEARRIAAEAERLTKERDEKIRARARTLEQQLDAFQKARTAEAEARFKELVAALEEEGRQKIEARQAEMRAELEEAVRERDRLLRQAVEERRRLLVGGTEEQIRVAQEQYAKQLRTEGARLRAELEAVHQERLRLEGTMLAEVKIEVATVAQEQKIDVVLARVVANARAVDLTQAVIARLRRP